MRALAHLVQRGPEAASATPASAAAQGSEKTVRNHISHIYEKIGVVDRAQAALYAVRKGLIQA